jgi:hypothetical protein
VYNTAGDLVLRELLGESMDKIDRIFLSRNCPDCTVVRAEMDMNAVMEDDFRGAEGQKLFVFSALSDEATRELLDTFGVKELYTPVVETHDGKRYFRVKNILSYLKKNGMTVG